MPRKYKNFSEVLAFWETMDKTAIISGTESGMQKTSYRELKEKISARIRTLREENGRPAGKALTVLQVTAEEASIVELFARVISGYSVLLADPRLPSSVTEETKARADERLSAAAGPDTESGEKPSGEGLILFYTSGTASRSRCVILTSRSLCCSAWSGQSMLPCGPEDTLLCLLPLSHVFGFVCGMLWGLCYGAAIALGRGLRHLVDDCTYFHPTILPAVPSIAGMLDRFHLFNEELRVLLIGAAPCSDVLMKSLRHYGFDIYCGYGLTETSSGIAITQDLNEPYAMYACPGADIRIEENGEISVSTPCMMEGYLGEPSPLVNGRLLTGDLGRFDEKGRLHIEGRRKDMIVLPDGTKLFCPEYEAAFVQRLQTEAVALAEWRNRAVLVIESAAGGGHPEAFRKAAGEAVRTFNLDRARSQQIAEIIWLQEPLPRTAVGKLQRWKLQEMLNVPDINVKEQ